eukprot:CAMPEP_0194506280 /NCGR_PEP_ID=MMETSP0253-20130528/34456_1 /TAXON_ID=2966 /ORGANISM="Noctiluca scintillans" /LENGTH=71 /DNA_ID=CAMNT_0039348989 /DNA_START=253 /DNA_END=465 /DNA_ORIENTATION=+
MALCPAVYMIFNGSSSLSKPQSPTVSSFLRSLSLYRIRMCSGNTLHNSLAKSLTSRISMPGCNSISKGSSP